MLDNLYRAHISLANLTVVSIIPDSKHEIILPPLAVVCMRLVYINELGKGGQNHHIANVKEWNECERSEGSKRVKSDFEKCEWVSGARFCVCEPWTVVWLARDMPCHAMRARHKRRPICVASAMRACGCNIKDCDNRDGRQTWAKLYIYRYSIIATINIILYIKFKLNANNEATTNSIITFQFWLREFVSRPARPNEGKRVLF